MLPVLVAVLGAACVALGLTAFVLHRRLLAERADHAAPRVLTEMITVEITNHVDVAAGRTSLARPLGRLAPGLLRSVVHREAVRMMRVELDAQGVAADVRVRRVPVRRLEPSGPSAPSGPTERADPSAPSEPEVSDG